MDYAILTTTRFKEELENGRRTCEAVRIAVEQCSQSILTSGLTFFVATASVAVISKMELIKSLCLLISRGALISMAVILLVLPALLIVFAPLVQRTTWCWPKQKKGVDVYKRQKQEWSANAISSPRENTACQSVPGKCKRLPLRWACGFRCAETGWSIGLAPWVAYKKSVQFSKLHGFFMCALSGR